MKVNKIPFNIKALDTKDIRVKRLPKIKVPDIWEASSGEYHPDGLYSTVNFGIPGEDKRNQQHGVIDLRTTIFHPKLLKELFSLKGLYRGILEGKTYAIFDEKLKDFVAADALDGETGFSFFVTNYPKIKFRRNTSQKRDLRIDLIEKYVDTIFMNNLVVLPAGLRDIELTEGGRPIETELSKLYRIVLVTASTISDMMANKETDELDITRWKIQRAVNDVYEYLEGMISGKGGFIQRKWAARRVFGTTRNVISAMDMSAASLDSPRLPSLTQTQIGIHQFIKGCVPVIHNFLNQTVLSDFVNNPDGEIPLIDPKSLTLVGTRLSQKSRDKWLTTDGIEDLINGFGLLERRLKPILVDGKYLALIYRDEKQFRIFKDMSTFPEWLDKSKVSPLTWAELYYYAAHSVSDRVYGFITRYPVTGLGSIYPTELYCKSTLPALSLNEMSSEWTMTDKIYPEIPKTDVSTDRFVDTLIPHSATLGNLGAD